LQRKDGKKRGSEVVLKREGKRCKRKEGGREVVSKRKEEGGRDGRNHKRGFFCHTYLINKGQSNTLPMDIMLIRIFK
jgi:hypothetical protein